MPWNGQTSNVGPDVVAPSSGKKSGRAMGVLAGLFNTSNEIKMKHLDSELRRGDTLHRVVAETAGKITVDDNKQKLNVKTVKQLDRHNVKHAIWASQQLDSATYKDGKPIYTRPEQGPPAVARHNEFSDITTTGARRQKAPVFDYGPTKGSAVPVKEGAVAEGGVGTTTNTSNVQAPTTPTASTTTSAPRPARKPVSKSQANKVAKNIRNLSKGSI